MYLAQNLFLLTFYIKIDACSYQVINNIEYSQDQKQIKQQISLNQKFP